MHSRHDLNLVLLLCMAEVLAMTGFATYPALLTTLKISWNMTATEAGMVGGALFFGYMVGVPFLSSITDRIDAKKVFAVSCLLSFAGAFGFGTWAHNVWEGMFWQAISGAGLAGTYMPGLKVLTDRISGPLQSRYVSFYTATFGVGTSLSLLLSGWLIQVWSWPLVFQALSMAPIAAALMVWRLFEDCPPPSSAHTSSVQQVRGVLAQSSIRAYILGYGVHCWELFGLRSWQVAFLTFAFGMGSSQAWVSPTEAAAFLNLLGLPASIIGNEWAMRTGRIKLITWAMMASGVISWLVAPSVALPWMVILLVMSVYNIFVMADSASLTAGLISSTPASSRGTALAIYSFVGFGAGFVAPIAFGWVLDHSGGTSSTWAWTLSMGLLGIGSLMMGLYMRMRA